MRRQSASESGWLSLWIFDGDSDPDPEADAGLDMETFHTLIEQRLTAADTTEEQSAILQQLLEYGDSLLA